MKKFGTENTRDCIESALSNNHDLDKLPILDQAIKYAPKHVVQVINRFPNSVHVRDGNDTSCIPIHVAL